MRSISKKIKIFSFAAVVLYAASTVLYADVLTGKIESIRALKEGQMEITLKNGKEKQTVILTSATSVESNIPAKKIKTGSKIYLSAGSRGGRSKGRKGFKSPFRGIPKGIRKNMGLPNIPETPDIPGQPETKPNVPEVPKAPKAPKVPGAKGGAGTPAEAQADEQQQGRKKTQPPAAQEPTEEEKSLFGKADSSKSLLKGSNDSEESADAGKKVLKVENTAKGINLELQGLDGKNEQVTLQPDKTVILALSISELRKDMKVEANVDRSSQAGAHVAQKITVMQ